MDDCHTVVPRMALAEGPSASSEQMICQPEQMCYNDSLVCILCSVLRKLRKQECQWRSVLGERQVASKCDSGFTSDSRNQRPWTVLHCGTPSHVMASYCMPIMQCSDVHANVRRLLAS